jgi:3-oxoacyl-(acyl-carrier-protein) synthase
MKEIYIVDYLVHDHLGTDATSNYQRMQETKGPVDAIRYTPDDYPHVNCKKGFHMEYVDNNYTSYKLTVDLTNKIENLYGEQIPGESAVVFGSFGIGTKTRDEFNVSFLDGVRRFSPTKLFSSNHDLISALVAGKLKTTGVNTSINAACSSSMFNMHYASMLIETGQTPAAIVGAVDMTVEAKMQYYWQCTSAISTDNGGTCIPFDNKRDGFLQGEGGTAWYICDEETVKRHNLKPKAKLKSIVVGSKVTSMTAHDKTCENQIHLINQALKKAGLQASDISFFNAHATSTLVGDDIEVDVFQKVFENIDIPIVSFKGYIGHTMSACGLIESAYGLEALKAGYLHPNYNLTSPLSDDPRIITAPTKLSGKYFMKASFGFGGRTSIAIFESL